MTETMRDSILNTYHVCEPMIQKFISSHPHSEAEFLKLPFCDEYGIINNAVFNKELNKVTHIEVPMVKYGVVESELSPKDTALCDYYEIEKIEL